MAGGLKECFGADQVFNQQRRVISKISRLDLEDRYVRLLEENVILKKHACKQVTITNALAGHPLQLMKHSLIKSKSGALYSVLLMSILVYFKSKLMPFTVFFK